MKEKHIHTQGGRTQRIMRENRKDGEEEELNEEKNTTKPFFFCRFNLFCCLSFCICCFVVFFGGISVPVLLRGGGLFLLPVWSLALSPARIALVTRKANPSLLPGKRGISGQITVFCQLLSLLSSLLFLYLFLFALCFFSSVASSLLLFLLFFFCCRSCCLYGFCCCCCCLFVCLFSCFICEFIRLLCSFVIVALVFVCFCFVWLCLVLFVFLL